MGEAVDGRRPGSRSGAPDRRGSDPSAPRIHVDLAHQHLELRTGARLLRRYPVSTGANGAGERIGSGCTPRGLHQVRIKIGQGCPTGAVFRARRWTGEIYSPELAAAQPERDWILTRILWLTGLESGRNRGRDVDTLRRFIYIHGCPDSEPMGVACSHGCVRMENSQVVELCDLIPVGTLVELG
jgi:lipoprotein-anchoring transpeptidase ErfK/SrfK